MRMVLKNVLALTFLFVAAQVSVYAQNGEIKQALLLINKGENKEAVEYLLQKVNEFPKTAELRYLLAMALDKNGQTDMAIEEAKAVVTMKPKYKDNRRLLMNLYIKKENFKSAMEECQFLLKESKKDIGLKLNLCEIYLGLENYKDASTELAKLEVEKPNDNLVLTLLGDAYAKQRVNSLAIQYYNKALGVNPNAVNTKLKLAKLYFRETQYNEALKEYLDVVRMDTTNAEALLRIGIIYNAAGKSDVNQYGRAIGFLQRYIGIAPNDYAGYYYTGKSWHALRSWQNAVTNFESAMKLDDSARVKEETIALLSESYRGLGVNYLKDKNYDAMTPAIKKSIELNPASDSIAFEIGYSFYGEKNYATAASWFDISAQSKTASEPKIANSLFLSGVSRYNAATTKADSLAALAPIEKSLAIRPTLNNYLNFAQYNESVDQPAKARAAYEKAVEMDSNSVTAQLKLGILLFNKFKNDTEPAIKAFKKVGQLDEKGSYKMSHYFLGLCYLNAKKKPDAREAFKKYLEVDPTGNFSKQAKTYVTQLAGAR